MLPALLLVLACSERIEIAAVEPRAVRPGQVLEIRGRGLGEGTAVELHRESAVEPLLGTRTAGARARGTVPHALAPGTWDLVVRRGGEHARLPGAVTVSGPPEVHPCAGTWEANTELSLARQEVVIRRFGPSGDEDRVVVGLPDIRAVEVQELPMDDGRTCSAILLRTAGERVVLDASTDRDLAPRARALARQMDRPLR